MNEAREKRAVVIQHESVETLGGNFTKVLEEAGIRLIPVCLYQATPELTGLDPLNLAEIDLIITLGGSMSANDDLPALRQEIIYLRAALMGTSPTPVLGICLGAQLLSRALGGEVKPTGGYQFGLRKIDVISAGADDPVFREIRVPLVPTLHGDRFTVPEGGILLAEGTMLCRDGSCVRFPMAFRSGLSYGFQFEPQLTLEQLRVWNRELAGDYQLMGDSFDPAEEAARHLREFTAYAPVYELQMACMLRVFLQQVLA